MNEVFVIGEIVSKVEFKFIYKGKNTSKARCYIKLSNDSEIKIIGYDEIADFMYQYLKQYDVVFIYGRLNKEGEIISYKIRKIA